MAFKGGRCERSLSPKGVVATAYDVVSEWVTTGHLLSRFVRFIRMAGTDQNDSRRKRISAMAASLWEMLRPGSPAAGAKLPGAVHVEGGRDPGHLTS